MLVLRVLTGMATTTACRNFRASHPLLRWPKHSCGNAGCPCVLWPDAEKKAC